MFSQKHNITGQEFPGCSLVLTESAPNRLGEEVVVPPTLYPCQNPQKSLPRNFLVGKRTHYSLGQRTRVEFAIWSMRLLRKWTHGKVKSDGIHGATITGWGKGKGNLDDGYDDWYERTKWRRRGRRRWEREGGQTVSKRIRVLWPVSTCSDGLTSTIVGLSTVQTTRQNKYFSFRTDQPCWLTFHHS